MTQLTWHSDILTLASAAREFGYTAATLAGAARSGRLEAFTIGGSRGLFTTRAAVRASQNSGVLGAPRPRRKAEGR